MTNVLIVDDERNIRKAFAADVASAPDRYTLVDAIPGAESALPLCASGKVDLVIMDINTANYENGIEVSARIKQRWPGIRIIVTTSYSDMRTLDQARAAGVDSFWFKDYSPVELMEVMDRTMDGRNYWPEEAPDVELGNTTIHTLTDTEKEVLHYLVECISIKKMAEKMFVEETTVKTHLKNIYNKVGCSNKTELLVMVMQSKLVLPRKQEN